MEKHETKVLLRMPCFDRSSRVEDKAPLNWRWGANFTLGWTPPFATGPEGGGRGSDSCPAPARARLDPTWNQKLA